MLRPVRKTCKARSVADQTALFFSMPRQLRTWVSSPSNINSWLRLFSFCPGLPASAEISDSDSFPSALGCWPMQRSMTLSILPWADCQCRDGAIWVEYRSLPFLIKLKLHLWSMSSGQKDFYVPWPERLSRTAWLKPNSLPHFLHSFPTYVNRWKPQAKGNGKQTRSRVSPMARVRHFVSGLRRQYRQWKNRWEGAISNTEPSPSIYKQSSHQWTKWDISKFNLHWMKAMKQRIRWADVYMKIAWTMTWSMYVRGWGHVQSPLISQWMKEGKHGWVYDDIEGNWPHASHWQMNVRVERGATSSGYSCRRIQTLRKRKLPVFYLLPSETTLRPFP